MQKKKSGASGTKCAEFSFSTLIHYTGGGPGWLYTMIDIPGYIANHLVAMETTSTHGKSPLSIPHLCAIIAIADVIELEINFMRDILSLFIGFV